MSESAFSRYIPRAYPYRFRGQLIATTMAGGTPTSKKKAEGWLRTRLADREDLTREAVAQVMAERGLSVEDATAVVVENEHLNGFKRDPGRNGELYLDGRCLKACIKEAASVAAAAGKLPKDRWGKTNKGILGFVAEHICVAEDRLHLGVTEPTEIIQRFVHTWRGNGIQYEEVVCDAKVDFTVMSDFAFTEEQWAMLWLTAEQQGLGASRSQGYGRFTVTKWEEDQ